MKNWAMDHIQSITIYIFSVYPVIHYFFMQCKLFNDSEAQGWTHGCQFLLLYWLGYLAFSDTFTSAGTNEFIRTDTFSVKRNANTAVETINQLIKCLNWLLRGCDFKSDFLIDFWQSTCLMTFLTWWVIFLFFFYI